MRTLIVATLIHVVALGTGWAAGPFEALPSLPPIPDANPQSLAKVELGKQLFFDPRLSSSGTVSCNSCHNVMAGGEDGRGGSVGVGGQVGGRSAPTVWNAAFLSVQFWDGRAATLEEQAKGPLINPIEMGMPDHDAVIAVVRGIPGYIAAFAAAFGGSGVEAVTIDRLAQAIAAYERTLITPQAPFDRYLNGDQEALSADAKAGLALFQSTGCVACHMGAALAGPALPAGQGWYQRFPTYRDDELVARYDLAADTGREQVTRREADRHMFRVPTLRNVALTAPYFHNGKVRDLPEAVRVMARVQLNRTLKDDEVAKLVAFLESLSGELPAQTMPRLPATPGVTAIR